VTLWGALAGGAVGTILLTSGLRIAQEVGWTRMDIPLLLGTVFTDRRGRASVIGYAELMMRQIPTGSEHRAAAEVIQEQAQRMALIVQKIGKITRYETRSYVGATNILDLDKSAPEDE